MWRITVFFILLASGCRAGDKVSSAPRSDVKRSYASGPDGSEALNPQPEVVLATATRFLCNMCSAAQAADIGIDCSGCPANTVRDQKKPVPRVDVERQADGIYDYLFDLIGEGKIDFSPASVWSNLTRASKPIVKYSIDVLTLIIALTFGSGAAIAFAVILSLHELIHGSFVDVVISVVSRIGITILAPGIAGAGSAILILVMLPVLILGMSSAVEGMPLVFLTLIGVLYGLAMAIMSTRNKIPVDATALVALTAVRFFGALRPILTASITTSPSITNVALLLARCLILGSGPSTMFATASAVHDARHLVSVLPDGFFDDLSSTDDVDGAFYGFVLMSLLLRVAVIFSFRYAMTRMRYTKPFRDPVVRDPLVVVQYYSAVFTYVPVVLTGGDHHVVLVMCNMIVASSMLAGNVDLFFLALGAYILSLGAIGEPVYEQSQAMASKARSATKRQVVKHIEVIEELEDDDDEGSEPYVIEPSPDTFSRQAKALRDALPRDLKAQVSVDVSAAAVKTINRATTPIKTVAGRGTAVFTGPRTLLTVRHVFGDLHGPEKTNLDDYSVSLSGTHHVPKEVYTGPRDAHGDSVIMLKFPHEVTSAEMFPVMHKHNPGLAHIMLRRGGVSVDTGTTLVHQHPPSVYAPLVQYEHEGVSADSGCGGYQLDGSAHVLLTTLHVGIANGKSFGITVPESTRFKQINMKPAPDHGTIVEARVAEPPDGSPVPLLTPQEGPGKSKRRKSVKESAPKKKASNDESTFAKMCASVAKQLNALARTTRSGQTVHFTVS